MTRRPAPLPGGLLLVEQDLVQLAGLPEGIRVYGVPATRLAMQRAGYASGDEYAQVTDIGLLAYRAADEPRLVRQNDTQHLDAVARPRNWGAE